MSANEFSHSSLSSRITFSDENGEFFDGDASRQGHMNFEPSALQLFLLLTKI